MDSGSILESAATREERKQLRRARVEARRAAEAAGGGAGGAHDSRDELGVGQQQVADSLALLDHRKAATINLVTGVRVEGDWRENRRRIKEEEERQERLRLLQEEAVESGKANAAVEMRWAELMELNMPQVRETGCGARRALAACDARRCPSPSPLRSSDSFALDQLGAQELFGELRSQQGACGAILSRKDALIRRFQTSLREKDEEYVKALRSQGAEVEQLLERMTAQYTELRRAYEQELEQVEDAFMAEREGLLGANRKGASRACAAVYHAQPRCGRLLRVRHARHHVALCRRDRRAL